MHKLICTCCGHEWSQAQLMKTNQCPKCKSIRVKEKYFVKEPKKFHSEFYAKAVQKVFKDVELKLNARIEDIINEARVEVDTDDQYLCDDHFELTKGRI